MIVGTSRIHDIVDGERNCPISVCCQIGDRVLISEWFSVECAKIKVESLRAKGYHPALYHRIPLSPATGKDGRLL